MRTIFARWHARTERYQGPVLVVAGGVWDFYTLQLERLFDNGLLFAYLLVYAAATIADLRHPSTNDKPTWRVWALHLASQFALGGLLSAYFVHYLRGAPVQRELVWLLVLGALAFATELRPTLARQPLVRMSLLAIVTFNYFLTALPLLTRTFLGPTIPMALTGFMVTGVIVGAAWGRKLEAPILQAGVAGLAAIGLQLAMVAADLVPPLPLTLMTAQVEADADGSFVELGSATELVSPVGLFVPKLPWVRRSAVRVRTPVYLPSGMSTQIVHEWQRFETKWITSDTVVLKVTGGREGGFRTYSTKTRTEPGSWRVIVRTEDGRELGRIHFDLVPQPQ